MFPSQSRTIWVKGFKGYSDVAIPSDEPTLSPDEKNVFTRFGSVNGRGGMTKFDAISTASGGEIIQLCNYRQADGGHELVRIMPTAVEEWDGAAWADITDSALTGTTSSKPIYTIIDDTLVFTNGVDLPQKWAGSGNIAPIALGTSPYAKGCIAYLGFLFLFDVSDDGSFTDVFDGHRIGRYSDDWDNDWANCDGNEITLDETPGKWLNACVLGRTMFALKSDGVVAVRFTPSQVRFQQDEIPSDVGILSPLSLAVAGKSMAFFLGTDGIIYLLTPTGLKAVTYESLSHTLSNTKSLGRLQHARGVIDSANDRYVLFYDRTGLTTQRLDSWVSYNYRTEEVDKGECLTVISTTEFQENDQSASQILTANTTLVHEFNSTLGTDDGTAVSRFWTSGHQPLGGETGWLHGLRLLFDKSRFGRVAVSVAPNLSSQFTFRQVFDLKGGKTDQNFVELEYLMPPQFVEWCNVKIEFFHDGTASQPTSLQRLGFVVTPKAQVGIVKSPGVGSVRA